MRLRENLHSPPQEPFDMRPIQNHGSRGCSYSFEITGAVAPPQRGRASTADE
jgi:hypothetical protein